MFEPLKSQRERQDHGSISIGNGILLGALIALIFALAYAVPL